MQRSGLKFEVGSHTDIDFISVHHSFLARIIGCKGDMIDNSKSGCLVSLLMADYKNCFNKKYNIRNL
jgi:hypothetical protein